MKEFILPSKVSEEVAELVKRGEKIANPEAVRDTVEKALDMPLNTEWIMERISSLYNNPGEPSSAEVGNLEMFHQKLMQANAAWHVPFERPLPPTPGVPGNKVRIFLKRLIRKGLRGVLKPLFAEQDAYNMVLVQSLNSAFTVMNEYKARLDAQQAEIAIHGAVIGQQKAALQEQQELQDYMKAQYDHEHRPVDMDYIAFEDEFRGSAELIHDRIVDRYQAYFENVDDILDIGCGRGEFMQIMQESGKRIEGCDIDEEMIQACQERGLNASLFDGCEYLSQHPEKTYGGIVSLQVVEHISPADLVDMVQAAYAHLRDGGAMVIETINPTSLQTHRYSFPLDMSHRQFVHPMTLEFLLRQAGFREVEVRYYEPVLYQLTPADFGLKEENERLNGYLLELNKAIFGCQDYSIFARK